MSAGCDPLYIARRLLAIASEDVGNADPRAMQVALSAWDCFHRIGPAEGERAIAQAIVYLACAPKSNAVYTAWKAALNDAKNLPDFEVPVHLRNAPTRLMSDLGYGAEYRYAHDEPGAYAAGEEYFPPSLPASSTISRPIVALKSRSARSSIISTSWIDRARKNGADSPPFGPAE